MSKLPEYKSGRKGISTKIIMSAIIGILGGMGPEATADLYRKIIKETGAKRDQDHIKTIIISDPQIPDRTEYIVGQGESPLPALMDGVKKLESLGCNVIGIPCNTAHYFHSHLQRHSSAHIVNMIEETALFIKEEFPEVRSVGLLATSGTIQAKVYHLLFAKHGMAVLSPDENDQELAMQAIYGENGIKAGKKQAPRKLLLETTKQLQKKGVDIFILGCTEIPLVLKQKHLSMPVVDPTAILAQSLVKYARHTAIGQASSLGASE